VTLCSAPEELHQLTKELALHLLHHVVHLQATRDDSSTRLKEGDDSRMLVPETIER
jgi:hypothetical protein